MVDIQRSTHSDVHKALAVAASIILERAVDVGIGRHDHTLTRWELDAYVKVNPEVHHLSPSFYTDCITTWI